MEVSVHMKPLLLRPRESVKGKFTFNYIAMKNEILGFFITPEWNPSPPPPPPLPSMELI